jgi:sugar/nucleoside kinase (ribokinase family)
VSATDGRSRPRVVVLGDLILDVVVALDEPAVPDSDAAARTRLTLGGAAANVAAWVAHAGGRAVLIGRVGADAAGREHQEVLRRRGVEARLVVDPGASTGTVVALTAPDGSRTMLTDRGANLRLRAEDVPTDLGGAGDHLHLSGYTLLHEATRSAAQTALEAAGQAGLSTSVDASSAGPLRQVGSDAFLAWTHGVDVLRANREEALLLAPGADDAEEAVAALATRCPTVVVSDGPRGAWVAAGGLVHHEPAHAAKVRDTVGAGDALTAGFLTALLSGRPPAQALAAGVELATQAIGRVGAQPPLPGAQADGS